MSHKHQIRLRDFVTDIRAGLSRPELMEKYGLTFRELHRAFAKLLETGAVTYPELPEKAPTEYGTVVQENIRDLLRHDVDFDIPLYAADRPEVIGRIRDITSEGVGLTGIKAKVGEIKSLVALGDEFGEVGPFEFEARCRWFRRGDSETDTASGFEITRITDADYQELKKLILVVTTGG